MSAGRKKNLKTTKETTLLANNSGSVSLSGISPTALSLNTLAQGSSADNSSSNDSVLRKPTIAASLSSDSNTKSVGSFNIDRVSVSEPPHTVSPPTSLSSAAVAQSHQARVSDGSEMPAQSVLLAAPLSSLSRSGGSLSVQSVTSLSVPLSHLSGLGGLPSLSESQNTDNNKFPLTLGSLSQLSPQQGPLSNQPVTSSSSSLLSVPLSSLSGKLGMSSVSKPVKDDTKNPPLTLNTSQSQLSSQQGSLSGQALPLSSSSLLSVPLSSLSGQIGESSLSEPPNSGLHNPPLTLKSLSQLSSQKGSFGPSNSLSSSPLLSPLNSVSQKGSAPTSETTLGSLLNSKSKISAFSLPLRNLAEISKSGSESGEVITQGPSLSMLHGSLLHVGHSPGSGTDTSPSKLSQSSGTSLSSSPLPNVGTLNGNSLVLKLTDLKIHDNLSGIHQQENDHNHNQTMEHKGVKTPVMPSMSDMPVNQEQLKSVHAGNNKPIHVATSAKKDSVNIHIGKRTKKHLEVERDVGKTQIRPSPLRAKPTMFALTMCSAHNAAAQRVVKQLYNADLSNITPFDFSSPSPDDIVNEKHKKAFLRKK